MHTTRARLNRLQRLVASRVAMMTTPALERLRQDPARLLADAGLAPDPWQADLLRRPSRRALLLCSRQSGKSQVGAALALRSALFRPGSLVLLLSPTLRQSGELFRDKVLPLYRALGRPVPGEATALELRLANGSRVVSLPGSEASIRGFSRVRLLICDEAARIPDELYRSVRPMLAVGDGDLVCLTTPFGRRGWFYDAWTGTGSWDRVKVTATDCPRISPEFLAEERQALGPRWYSQEYEVSFEELVGAVFSSADIQAALCPALAPLFGAPQ